MTRAEALGILGLSSTATPNDIKKAYRNLVKITHPDKDDSPGAHQRFILVKTAYEILSDPQVQREAREQAERERKERERKKREQIRVNAEWQARREAWESVKSERERQEKEKAEQDRLKVSPKQTEQEAREEIRMHERLERQVERDMGEGLGCVFWIILIVSISVVLLAIIEQC